LLVTFPAAEDDLMADIQADANADPGAVDALARVGYVLQTSAEIIQVFIHCARDDLTARPHCSRKPT
jgi:hypothetical protein